MVGFTISPLLWKYVGQALSAGRCQTPALRLLADREEQIKGFQAETVWKLKGTWGQSKGTLSFPAVIEDSLEDEESARNFLENLHNEAGGTVIDNTLRPTMESPPAPLITSTLQQEASAMMGVQPKNTMRVAQRLYEAGHITYMRTDSAVLSEEARVAAESWVREAFGEEYLRITQEAEQQGQEQGPKAKAKAKSKKKPAEESKEVKAQEAHEAIRPTHIEVVDLPATEDWNAMDRKVYKLIWNRTVQSVMAPARGEKRTLHFKADGDPSEFQWTATWTNQIFAGWKRIGVAATNLDAEDDSEQQAQAQASKAAWTAAAALTPQTPLAWTHLEAAPVTSSAVGRYTEATLVRELERKGIGRPSTFASLVGTVLDKAYAEKRDTPATLIQVPRLTLEAVNQWPPTQHSDQKKVGAERQKLAPTALGQSVLEFCLKEFGGLFAYEFTKEMEARLDAVAVGSEDWKNICRDTWGTYKERYQALQKAPATKVNDARQKMFAGGVKAVQGKKGPILLKEGATPEETVFYGWPPGVAFGALTEEVVASFVATKVVAAGPGAAGGSLGSYEGHPMVKKSGPFGAYVECNGIKVPWTEADTEETLTTKLQEKSQSLLHTIGLFEFRKGPYGVYMLKKDVKAKKFVSLPSAVDPKMLTLEAAVKLYQTGLQKKATNAAYSKAKGAAAKDKDARRS